MSSRRPPAPGWSGWTSRHRPEPCPCTPANCCGWAGGALDGGADGDGAALDTGGRLAGTGESGGPLAAAEVTATGAFESPSACRASTIPVITPTTSTPSAISTTGCGPRRAVP
jgi:hypothetical protein